MASRLCRQGSLCPLDQSGSTVPWEDSGQCTLVRRPACCGVLLRAKGVRFNSENSQLLAPPHALSLSRGCNTRSSLFLLASEVCSCCMQQSLKACLRAVTEMLLICFLLQVQQSRQRLHACSESRTALALYSCMYMHVHAIESMHVAC